MIAYLINQYPKVSHVFIRREILSLESKGETVLRIAVRGWKEICVDPVDTKEQTLSFYLLQQGLVGLFFGLICALRRFPRQFLITLFLAVRLSKGSDKGFFYHLIYFTEACLASRHLYGKAVTHIHAHFGTNSATVAMLLSCLTHLPFSFTVHGADEIDKPELLKLKEKIAAAKFTVAISSFGRGQLYRWAARGDWPKIHVVRCGVDSDFLNAPPTPPPDNQRLVCVGRLCNEKGQLLLIEALKLLKLRGVICELVLAGDGELRSEIEQLLHVYQLTNTVRITGWLTSAQVREEIIAARALVLPSFLEGLPVVIMEAMSLGRPILSTYVSGIPELVINGENGWLFPSGDVEAIAENILKCLSAPQEHLNLLAQNARMRAGELHNTELEVAKLLELFRSGD